MQTDKKAYVTKLLTTPDSSGQAVERAWRLQAVRDKLRIDTEYFVVVVFGETILWN